MCLSLCTAARLYINKSRASIFFEEKADKLTDKLTYKINLNSFLRQNWRKRCFFQENVVILHRF